MGVWDTGNFSNDTALDFVAGVGSVEELKRPLEILSSQVDGEIDEDLALEVLAAADLLAGLLGRPAADQPYGVGERFEQFGEPDKQLLVLARSAVDTVYNQSPLRELWDEEDSEGWKGEIDDLLKRLDPSSDYRPAKRNPAAKGGFVCTVCAEIIPVGQEVHVEIEFPNMPGTTMGRYLHKDCLEANFEPPHMDKNGAASTSLKTQILKFIGI